VDSQDAVIDIPRTKFLQVPKFFASVITSIEAYSGNQSIDYSADNEMDSSPLTKI